MFETGLLMTDSKDFDHHTWPLSISLQHLSRHTAFVNFPPAKPIDEQPAGHDAFLMAYLGNPSAGGRCRDYGQPSGLDARRVLAYRNGLRRDVVCRSPTHTAVLGILVRWSVGEVL